MPRFLMALVLPLAALGSFAEPAAACSCALGDPRRMLGEADAAFVGVLVERREPAELRSSADPVTLIFRVEKPVKGELGELVELETAAFGASCGVEADQGKRVGLFLTRTSAGWTSSLCQQIEAATLLQVEGPIVAPGGRGVIADEPLFYSALESFFSFLRPLCRLRLFPMLR